jgi:hypothetical protein
MQSVTITTDVVSYNPAQGDVHNIMNDNINMDSTIAGSMNDNINMDSTIAGSMNARS